MKKNGTLKIALTAFFLICVLPPLSCGSYAKPITSDPSRGASGHPVRNAPVYLFKAFYAASSRPDKSENEPSPHPVLIAKKSAVLRSRFDLVPLSGGIAVFTPADLAARQDFSIEDKRAAIMRSWLRKNYACLRLSSGVSPPPLS